MPLYQNHSFERSITVSHITLVGKLFLVEPVGSQRKILPQSGIHIHKDSSATKKGIFVKYVHLLNQVIRDDQLVCKRCYMNHDRGGKHGSKGPS